MWSVTKKVMKAENNFPCVCGHDRDMHWDEDDEDNHINEGIGHCQEELDRGGHHCSSCGFDPDDYCRCEVFKPDNLEYLERQYNNIK